jgi:hypothetical protein
MFDIYLAKWKLDRDGEGAARIMTRSGDPIVLERAEGRRSLAGMSRAGADSETCHIAGGRGTDDKIGTTRIWTRAAYAKEQKFFGSFFQKRTCFLPAYAAALCRSRRNWKNSTPSRNRRFIICGLVTISPTIEAIFGARK